MADEQIKEHQQQHEKKVFKFSVDGKVFEYDKETISGAEIRTIAHIDPSFSLFMEVRGEDGDRQIADSTSIRLSEHEIEKFYTVPPATLAPLMGLFEEQFEDLKKQYSNAEVKNDGTGAMLIKIPDFPLPQGWNKQKTNIFFKAPVGYPVSKPDCFWVDADVRLAGGNMPKNSGMQAIPPESDQKLWFSWHTNAWIPNQNNLKSYVGIIFNRLQITE